MSVPEGLSAGWDGEPVLVAGGTGFIGSAVAEALLARGAKVTVASRSARLRSDDEAVAVQADLTEMAAAREVCRGKAVVFLLAAMDGNAEFKVRHAAEILRSNSLIVLNVLQAAHEAGVRRVVLVSSSDVYSATASGLLSDSPPLSSISNLNPYALSKVFGEVAALKFVDQFGLEVVIARPANVYGPGDDLNPERGRVIARWIALAAKGQPLEIWGTGEEARSYIYVDDLVRGLILLAEAGPIGRPVNLAHPAAVTLDQLARSICRLGGFRAPIVLVPRGTPSAAAARVLDTTLARDVFGFEAQISLDEGLARTIIYMQKKLS